MIQFSETVLKNGLKVLAHSDKSSPLVAVNILYKVGSRNEHKDQTGIAHLFEHLMFSGSKNAPNFDEPLQLAGGENNAFTNADVTNFYNVVPAENIETALWLESDRMVDLDLSEKNLSIQKKVVIEEFGETTLNKPYGDTWHHVSKMCYKSYPYRWPTIGFTPDHISSVTRENALNFYKEFYKPNNAVLSISGNIDASEALVLAEKWFGDIPSSKDPITNFQIEKNQEQQRSKTVYGNVPSPSIIIAFPMPDRRHPDFYAYDILSDILGLGKSNRLYKNLVIDNKICSQITTYITGTDGPGLFVFDGKPNPGISAEEMIQAVWDQLEILKNEAIDAKELQKIKNSVISHMAYSETSILSKAISLCYFENVGNVNLINNQIELYEAVDVAKIQLISNELFQHNKSNILMYLPSEKE